MHELHAFYCHPESNFLAFLGSTWFVRGVLLKYIIVASNLTKPALISSWQNIANTKIDPRCFVADAKSIGVGGKLLKVVDFLCR